MYREYMYTSHYQNNLRDGGGVRRGNRAEIRIRLQREGASGTSSRQPAESDDAERVRFGESPGARENVGGRKARLHGAGRLRQRVRQSERIHGESG